MICEGIRCNKTTKRIYYYYWWDNNKNIMIKLAMQQDAKYNLKLPGVSRSLSKLVSSSPPPTTKPSGISSLVSISILSFSSVGTCSNNVSILFLFYIIYPKHWSRKPSTLMTVIQIWSDTDQQEISF